MDHFRVLYSNTDCIDIHWLRMICMMIKYVDDHFEMFSPMLLFQMQHALNIEI